MIIEIVRYRLRDDVDEADFLDADAEAQQRFFYQQPGLLRRTTARGADGTWLALVLWADEASVDAAARNIADDPSMQGLMAMREQESISFERFSTLD